MKKRRIALAVLSCALLTGSLVACGGDEEPIYVKNEIVSIAVKTPPTKTTYKVGDVFDPAGIVIESTRKDGQKKIVSGYTWDKHDPLTVDDKVVTFTYQNFTCTLDITVREIAVKGIIIKEQPYKLEYKISQKFDPTGLVVHAVYEDDSTLEVKDYTIVDADRELKESDKEMIVRYKTFEAKINITVTDPVDVVVDDVKTIRLEAEELDFSEAILRDDFAQAGRGFIESPNDGSVTSGGKSICGYELNSIFKIRFEAKEDSTILIKAAMADIGKNYSLSEALEFKMDDQVIVAQDKEFGKNGYWDWCEFPVGVVSISKGKHTFSVKCVSAKPNMDYFDFVVTKYGDKVIEKELVGYEVKSAPTKTHYVAGETVDLSGLVLTAQYNDNSTEDITEGFTAKKDVVEITDTEIVAIYDGHEFAFPITVEGHVDYVIDDVKEITIEAEDLPVEGIEEKQADKDWAQLVEANSYASGGKSLHSVSKASWSWTFDLKEEFDLEVVSTVCKYEAIQTGGAYDVKVDGVHFDNDNITLGRTDGNDFYNFKESNTNIGKLSAGEHTISFNILSAVNVDKVLFKFSEPAAEPDYVIDEAKEITLEAEDLPIEGIEEKQADKDWAQLVEANPYASAGKSLHSVFKASWSWTFDLKEDYDLEAIATVCKYEAIQTGGAYDIKVDGEHFDNDNITLGRVDGNDWYNFKDSKTNVGKLTAGIHTISFNILSAVNVDKISFKFSEPATEPVEEPADYTINEAQNIRIEGENLPQSGIQRIQEGKQMNQLVESNAYSSNGASLHAVEAAEWSYVFDLKQELSLEVLARVGKYEDVSTGDRYSVVVDGVEIQNDNITLGHTEDNPRYTFKDSKSSVGNLAAGRHVIKFVIKQNINVDYIEFQFSALE